ncbi:MAG: hypothetical protein QNJ53_09465 [Pleurocapsa sp. MO_192.B19]|nr:hypothetical protein [Pleurocapsa sp. MO_192.B19]
MLLVNDSAPLYKVIPPEKAHLAAQLQTLADNYQFDEIVRLLNFS